MTSQADYDALLSAYNQGVTQVQFRDRTVRYRTLDEMDRILIKMRKELGIGDAGQTRRYYSYSKGLG